MSNIVFEEVKDSGSYYLIPLKNIEYHLNGDCLVLDYQSPIYKCNIAGKLVIGLDCEDFKIFLKNLADKCVEKIILEKDKIKRGNLNVDKLREKIHNNLYTLSPFGVIIYPNVHDEEICKSKLVTSKGKILFTEDIKKFKGKIARVIIHRCMIVVHKVCSDINGIFVEFLVKEAIFE